MNINITIGELFKEVDALEWERFCEDFGYSVWVVNEGGENIQISLTKEQAKKYGVI